MVTPEHVREQHSPLPSQKVLAPAQTVPAGANPFAGQEAFEPVHVSATSHTPADARHTYDDGR